jgi:hypothetical protein
MLRAALAVLALVVALATPAHAQRQGPGPGQFSTNELLNAGHSFFAGATTGLAGAIESAVARWGHPNGYILGEEGSGAFAVGLRYGEGRLRMRGRPELRIFWQGPSLGWDAGADGSRVMILVYNQRQPQDLLRRFVGLSGQAYFIGGLSVTALAADNIVVVPIKTGVGLRLGANIGYIKFTDRPDWNPF